MVLQLIQCLSLWENGLNDANLRTLFKEEETSILEFNSFGKLNGVLLRIDGKHPVLPHTKQSQCSLLKCLKFMHQLHLRCTTRSLNNLFDLCKNKGENRFNRFDMLVCVCCEVARQSFAHVLHHHSKKPILKKKKIKLGNSLKMFTLHTLFLVKLPI